MLPSPPPPAAPITPGTRAASGVVAAAPAVVLAAAAARLGSADVAAGAAAAGLLGLFLHRTREPAWKPPTSGAAILLYLTALTGLWAASRTSADPFLLFARGSLLASAVGLFVGHDLSRSGLGPRRKARTLCRMFAERTSWPPEFGMYPMMPEVRALQDAVRDDPTPALELLIHPREEVRAVGFAALRGRTAWRSGEAAAVVSALRRATDPSVRAAAVEALAAADDPSTVTEIGGLLRDPAPAVRAAAAAAVLAGGARRWPDVRMYVREALIDPNLADDGAFPGAAGHLSAAATCDLYTWAADAEPLGDRAARTLVEHYAALLRAGGSPELPHELGSLATDSQTPSPLRVELVGLLRDFGLVTPELLDRLTDADQPGPVRLLAAEVLLAADPNDPDALDVLRGLGRQPNRDTALAIARVLQGYLGLDMGLPPDMQVSRASKVALEAAKRVLAWATGGRPGTVSEPPMGRPLSAPTLSGLRPGGVTRPDRGSDQGPWGRR